MILDFCDQFGGQAFIEDVLPKIERARSILERHGLPVTIEADGGIKADNIARVVQAGVEVIVSGPTKPLSLTEPEATFEYVSPDPKIDLAIGAFNFDLRSSAVAEGLPPDTWEPNSSTRNLAAKQLEQAALRVRRERVLPYYRRALEETFAAHVAVGDYWAESLGRVRLGPDVRLGIDWAPLPEVVDRFQDVQASGAEVALGTYSPVERTQRTEGVTRAEAIRRLERRAEERDRFAVSPAPPASAVAGDGVARPPSVRG